MSSNHRELDSIRTWEAVKAQFMYKRNAYHSMLGTMMIMQIIALFFSFSGSFSMVSIDHISITTTVTNANVILSFTFLWGFMMAIYLTTKASKNMMAPFVTSKMTNHLANFLLMGVFSLIGGVTANLLGYFLKVVLFMYYGEEQFIYMEPFTWSGFLLGVTVTILYLFLIFAVGYTIGEIVQLHKTFIVIVPVGLFGLIIALVNTLGDLPFITMYIFESNFFVFVGKIMVTIAILFLISTQIGQGREVRR